MPASGVLSRSYSQTPGPTMPKKKKKEEELYPSSVLQSAQDYDELMGRYRNIADSPTPGMGSLVGQYEGLGNSDITPTPLTYTRGPEMESAVGNLKELSTTGGYTPEGIAAIRSRGLSPIRSVYANAERNLNRNKSLQGGYSPNYGAVLAKMAREQSAATAAATTNVEAGIAQNVAQNRLNAAPLYSGLAERETGAMSDIASRNAANKLSADTSNRENKFNATSALERIYGGDRSNRLNAVEGMRALYGTTPALPALYGQQGLQREQLKEQQRSRKQQGSSVLINAYGRAA